MRLFHLKFMHPPVEGVQHFGYTMFHPLLIPLLRVWGGGGGGEGGGGGCRDDGGGVGSGGGGGRSGGGGGGGRRREGEDEGNGGSGGGRVMEKNDENNNYRAIRVSVFFAREIIQIQCTCADVYSSNAQTKGDCIR